MPKVGIIHIAGNIHKHFEQKWLTKQKVPTAKCKQR